MASPADRVRSALPGDVEAIASVHDASWRTAYRGLLPPELLDLMDPVRRVPFWRRRFAAPHPRSGVLVVEGDGAPLCGFLSFAPASDEPATTVASVDALYVDPDRFGEGFGRALLRAALGELASEGFEEVILSVLVGNERAEGFYARAGFVSDGSTEEIVLRGRPLPHTTWTRTLL